MNNIEKGMGAPKTPEEKEVKLEKYKEAILKKLSEPEGRIWINMRHYNREGDKKISAGGHDEYYVLDKEKNIITCTKSYLETGEEHWKYIEHEKSEINIDELANKLAQLDIDLDDIPYAMIDMETVEEEKE